jgi:hypothetical protein
MVCWAARGTILLFGVVQAIHRKKGSDKLLYLRRLYGSFQVYRGDKDGLPGVLIQSISR